MEKRYRIVFESYESNKPEITISKTTLLDDGIDKAHLIISPFHEH